MLIVILEDRIVKYANNFTRHNWKQENMLKMKHRWNGWTNIDSLKWIFHKSL